MTRLTLAKVLGVILVAACAESADIHLSAESGSLSVEARITATERGFRDEFAKVSGEVAIKNTDAEAQEYSNSWLWLSDGDEIRYRAWLDSLASHHVDVGTIEIDPKSTLELSVYWAVPESELDKLTDGAFVLIVGPERTESQYDRSYVTHIDGQKVEVRASEVLIDKPIDGLSPKSREIHRQAIAVFLDSNSESTKKEYLAVFPDSFDEFLAVFHQDDFSELYMESFTYLDLFHQLSIEFPELGLPKYASLAAEVCFDADAPNQFRVNFREMRSRFPELYEKAASELTDAQLRHIELVDGASIHDWEPEEVMCGYSGN